MENIEVKLIILELLRISGPRKKTEILRVKASERYSWLKRKTMGPAKRRFVVSKKERVR